MPSIKDTAQHVANLIKVHRDNLANITGHRDDDLSPEALGKLQQERADKARADALAEVDKARKAAEAETSRARAAYEAARPTIPHEAADLIAAQQVWEYDVKPVLESGTTLKQFLKSATTAQVLAAERFAGGYLTAKQSQGLGNPLEFDGPAELEAAAVGRLAMLTPESAQVIEDGYRAAVAAEQFTQVADLAEAEIRGDHIGFGSDRWGRAATIVHMMPDTGNDHAAA